MTKSLSSSAVDFIKPSSDSIAETTLATTSTPSRARPPRNSLRRAHALASSTAAVTLLYRRINSTCTVQLFLGLSKLESILRYLGIDVDDAIDIYEKIEIRSGTP